MVVTENLTPFELRPLGLRLDEDREHGDASDFRGLACEHSSPCFRSTFLFGSKFSLSSCSNGPNPDFSTKIAS